ncbi:DUF5615 family PIN-like protein [Candidatus Parcubacteria bacterium]|nr:DUF5615 family PIN-like protein [Candidatus Parcubacteria bacterium]
MFRFLLNSNLSFETADFLINLGCDAKTTAQLGLSSAPDEEVIQKATREKRIIVTFDLDFGEIFYFSKKINLRILVLRLKNQTVESVNKTLKHILESKVLESQTADDWLIVAGEQGVRVRRK